MKKAQAIKHEDLDEDEELQALHDLIKKQNELDKKLHALLVTTTGE